MAKMDIKGGAGCVSLSPDHDISGLGGDRRSVDPYSRCWGVNVNIVSVFVVVELVTLPWWISTGPLWSLSAVSAQTVTIWTIL